MGCLFFQWAHKIGLYRGALAAERKMEVSGLVSDGEKFSELDGNSKDHSCGLFHYRRDGE